MSMTANILFFFFFEFGTKGLNAFEIQGACTVFAAKIENFHEIVSASFLFNDPKLIDAFDLYDGYTLSHVDDVVFYKDTPRGGKAF